MNADAGAMTGDEYLASLDDGRLAYFEGHPVDDLVTHPVFGPCVARIAEEYDGMLASGTDVFSRVPRSPRDLREQMEYVGPLGMMAQVTYVSLMTLTTAAGRLRAEDRRAAERIEAYVADVRRRDVRVTQGVTDAKGDRSKPPRRQSDPDAYVRVVERRPDGVVIRGAKLHVTGSALGHELMIIPTKSMKPGEEDYAIGVVIPVSAPGVKIVNSTYAPRGGDPRSYPVSARVAYPEGFVILDDVFVPEERVLLDGLAAQAGVFAHSLGLWERLISLSKMVDEAHILVGLGYLIAEANGLLSISHIKDKLSEMVIHSALLRASLEAAMQHCTIEPNGIAVPDELFTNAGKFHGAAHFTAMVRHLHDIAGGSVVTAPSLLDLENPDVGPLVEKYITAAEAVDGEERLRLFHAIRDMTADTYGGWQSVIHLQSGGGLYAQRTLTRSHYPVADAKARAREHIGMAPAPAP